MSNPIKSQLSSTRTWSQDLNTIKKCLTKAQQTPTMPVKTHKNDNITQ